jgi:hypothetical protein
MVEHGAGGLVRGDTRLHAGGGSGLARALAALADRDARVWAVARGWLVTPRLTPRRPAELAARSGQVDSRSTREPLVVSLAQGIVLLHAALLGMVTMMAFFGYLAAILDRTDRPVPLGLSLASLVGAPAVTAAVATIGVRLGPGRPWIWRGAILLGLAAAATYGWLAYTMVVAPSPEGMLALAALMMGPPLVLGSLAGVGLLLTPRARAYCRDGR